MVVLGPDGSSALTPRRLNLVVAVVGDSSRHRRQEQSAQGRAGGVQSGRRCWPAASCHCPAQHRPAAPPPPRSWLEQPAGGGERNWDLLAIYYGDAPARFSCAACVGVAAAQGPKWRLAGALLSAAAWQTLAAHYAATMFADDDLEMTAAVVSATFDVLHARQLLAAQPSVCAGGHSMYPMVFQDRRYALRFAPLVEIMAPALAMPFLQATVRPTLEGVCVGWGAPLLAAALAAATLPDPAL